MDPTGEQIVPVQAEPTSVSSSDPSIVTVDSNYSSLTNTWSLDYQCKKAGVAVVTITYRDGVKEVILIMCGVRFPFQHESWKNGTPNNTLVTGRVDEKGTLTVHGLADIDGKTKSFDITVPGYAKAATAPAPVKIAPQIPNKPEAGDHGD